MSLKPIFDTNIFGHVQESLIPESDWRFLLRHRPGHGWPLSMVTALELLAGVHDAPSEKFPQIRGQMELAYKISRGRVLEEPRFLMCKEVLRLPFPPALARVEPGVIADHMEVVRCAKSLEEIREGRVRVRKLLTKGNGYGGFSGFDASVVKELVAGPKKEWVQRTEKFADEVFPGWREHFSATGKRLPDEMRKKLTSRQVWDAEKIKFTETILRWLEAGTQPEIVSEIAKRLDAVFEFTSFVDREILLGNYNTGKHDSDVYDQFQLHYLAIDRFVIVSQDPDLSTRTSRSSQVHRIMSLEKFLRTL